MTPTSPPPIVINPMVDLGPQVLGYERMGNEIAAYFKTQGVEEWQLGGIASRELVFKLEAEAEKLAVQLELALHYIAQPMMGESRVVGLPSAQLILDEYRKAHPRKP